MRVISLMVFSKDEDDISSKVVSMRVIGPVGDIMAKVCTTKYLLRRYRTLAYPVVSCIYIVSKGFLSFYDGSSYRGGFENGVANGQGEETAANGSVRVGIWENGRPA
jgi:MORN repeat